MQEIINSWGILLLSSSRVRFLVPTIAILSRNHITAAADADRIHKLKIMFSVDANDDNGDDDCDDDYYYAIRLH